MQNQKQQKKMKLPLETLTASNILLKPLERKEVEGVLSSENYEDKKVRGEVVLVGPDVEWIEVGDVVRFEPYAYNKMRDNGTDWMLIREEDIWGVEPKSQ